MPYLSLPASTTAQRRRPRSLASRLVFMFRTGPDWISRARRVTAERRALGRMDDRMLADIGFSQASAKNEAERRFWDLD